MGLWLFVVVLICTICSNTFSLEITELKENWTLSSSNTSCLLFGSRRNGLLEVKDIPEIHRSTEAWIGAHVTYSDWIKILGCQYGNISDNIIHSFNINDSVEVCMKQCASSRKFGLTLNSCHCSNETVPTLCMNRCDGQGCGPGNNYMCGNNSGATDVGTSCVCWYERFIPEQNVASTGNCMTVKQQNSTTTKYITENCSAEHQVICFGGQKNELFLLQKSYKAWNDSLKTCQHDCAYLSWANETSLPKLNRREQVWIGVFRVQSFHWGITNDNDGKCVALMIDENNVTSPVLKSCSDMLPSLCEKGSTTQPAESFPTRNHQILSTERVTSRNNQILNTERFPSRNHQIFISKDVATEQTTSIVASNTEESLSVPLSAILLPALGTVTIVTIITVICVIKRYKKLKKKSNNSFNQSTLDVNDRKSQNNQYTSFDKDHKPSVSSLTYSVKYDQVNSVSCVDNSDHIYNHFNSTKNHDNGDDSQYDHTSGFGYGFLKKKTKNRGDYQNSNYDVIRGRHNSSGVYDTNVNHTTQPNEDTYDHM